jgi:hypothetical protein
MKNSVGSAKVMTKQDLIFGKIKKCCDDAIDCYDDCMFFSEEYDECIFRVLGLDSPDRWECENNALDK